MNITMHKNMSKMEKSIKGKVMEFLMKLDADESSSGLHIEPIRNSADRRFRTGRVDKFWRAVLFKLTGKSGTSWVIYGVYPHDKAIEMARFLKLDVNPTNGVTEITLVDKVDADELASRLETPNSNQAPVAAASAEEMVDNYAPGTNHSEAVKASLPATFGRTEADPVFGDKPLAETLGAVPDTKLISELGMWRSVVAKARSCRSVDELLDGLESLGAPEWQSDAMLDLASGTSYEDIVKKLFDTGSDDTRLSDASAAYPRVASDLAESDRPTGVPALPDNVELSQDDALIAGLRTSAAQLSFAEVENEDELKRVAEGGDFEAWRVFLHPEQRRWAQRGYNGPFRLSGGAGTGKTVVLLHRAVRLANATAPADGPAPRVVLTTFTRNLASELDAQVSTLDNSVPRAGKLGKGGLYVAGVDQLVAEVLRGANADELLQATTTLLGRAHQNVTNRSEDADWDRVLQSVSADLPERTRNRVFLKDEYEQVVLPNRISDKPEYLRIRRPGRGVKLSRLQRSFVWDVFEAYRARTATNNSVSFEEASHLAAVILEDRANVDDRPEVPESQRRAAYPADHLLVDEGQDLNPGHWMFLRALVRPGRDDLFIGEDSHQRIYGSKVVLSRFGISIVGRSRRLTLNYRTTEQNLAFGLHILSGGSFTDLEDSEESVEGYRSLRAGEPPVVRGFENLDEELEAVADVLKLWLSRCDTDPTLKPEQIAVLVRSDPGKAARRLGELDVIVQSVGRGLIQDGLPVVMTMHRAKGTEFRNVVIMHAGSSDIPSPLNSRFQPDEFIEDFNLRERSLLYVAATRARDQLVVTHSGDLSVIFQD
ncbi:UvrD-helicase domain-containing protein [Brevibacterium sp. BDJS002]|uniref:UvrD-helicase domain-containing protein n=1 Tax=Brevibacterium sp. BDJS002 TaxID=3020906 RepID=UPI002307EB8D|nr:UvrD-helicase domain-containing protein [Brevibacterium sp. BDJS002]WCE38797.1 UvrD-helicase domain-containing protein [Brevibacterium sp. BDJS002]